MEGSVSRTTLALVLETNNLGGGGASNGRAATSLERLLVHLKKQTRPLSALDEVVITHEGISKAAQAHLSAAAGAPLRFVQIPEGTGYYQAKNLGFEATRADVVAFGDGDCWPAPCWLDRLLAPFETEGGSVDAVAGRTTYRPDWLGVAATTIDFMYYPSPLGAGCTRNFYANNVAFRREVFAANRYQPAEGVYRGHCQVLGLRLQAQGVCILFEPRARTVHRFPDTTRDLLRLRLLRGEDTAELTPAIADAYLPMRLRWVGRLKPIAPLAMLGARTVFSLRSLGHQDMPEVHGVERLACLGAIGAITALDAAGATARSLRLPLGTGPRAADALSLSYHGDGDRLGGSAPRRGDLKRPPETEVTLERNQGERL